MRVDEPKTDGMGDAAKNGGDNLKVTFAPEQQAKVQELIDNAFKKAYTKAHKTAGSSEEVERLRTEVEGLKGERKSNAILKAVHKHNAVAPDEVAELLHSHIRLEEDGSLSVTGASGGVMINSAGALMTVDEYVGHWLSERPHHLRSAGAAGAGSQSARFSGATVRKHNIDDPAAWRDMPREEFDRLLREGIKVRGTTGQTYTFRDVKNPFLEAQRRKTAGKG